MIYLHKIQKQAELAICVGLWACCIAYLEGTPFEFFLNGAPEVVSLWPLESYTQVVAL